MSECTTLMHLPIAATSPTTIWYMKRKMEKRRQYEQCIMEAKHSTLIQLVFTDTGEILKQRWTFYKRLASLLATRENSFDSATLSLSWLCYCISSLWCQSSSALGVPAPLPINLSTVPNLYLDEGSHPLMFELLPKNCGFPCSCL